MKDIYLSLLNDAGDQGEIKNLTFQNLDSLQGSQFQLQDKNIQEKLCKNKFKGIIFHLNLQLLAIAKKDIYFIIL